MFFNTTYCDHRTAKEVLKNRSAGKPEIRVKTNYIVDTPIHHFVDIDLQVALIYRAAVSVKEIEIQFNLI